MTLPAVPLTYLILIEANLPLCRLEAILYYPAPACNPDQLVGVVIYSGSDGNDYEIRTIKPGGGGRFNVNDNGEDDRDPSWGSS